MKKLITYRRTLFMLLLLLAICLVTFPSKTFEQTKYELDSQRGLQNQIIINTERLNAHDQAIAELQHNYKALQEGQNPLTLQIAVLAQRFESLNTSFNWLVSMVAAITVAVLGKVLYDVTLMVGARRAQQQHGRRES